MLGKGKNKDLKMRWSTGITLATAAVFLLILFLAGCSSNKGSGDSKPQATAGSITIAGSTSVQPLSEELAAAFKNKNPQAKINVQGGGSSQGIKAVTEGVAEIGASSRELKEEEKKLGLKEYQIALDGLAVIVHPSNPINNLSVEQVRKIYAGQITNWREVGGKDAPINVITRESGSGTRGAFEEIVMHQEKITPRAIVQAATGSVKQAVSTDPNAIGYISMGYLTNDVKAIAVDNVTPSQENVKKGSYKLYRPFLYLTKGEPGGLTREYIDFVLSDEGQKIVAQHYIPVK